MEQLVQNCIKMKIAPAIPDGITDLSRTFRCCTALKKAPMMPRSVSFMLETFGWCINLEEVELPANVTNIYQTFIGCRSMKKAPVIPEKVLTMENAFSGCETMAGTLICDAEPTAMKSALAGTKISNVTGKCSDNMKRLLIASRK